MSVLGRSVPFIVGSSGPATLPTTNLLRSWKKGVGQTVSGGTLSAWVDTVASASLEQATTSLQPAVQGDGSLLFDGVGDFLSLASFVQAQPFTIYMLAANVVWTNNATLLDAGRGGSIAVIAMGGGSPNIFTNAGSTTTNIAATIIGTFQTMACGFSGASSFVQVDLGARATGNAGTNAASQIRVGERSTAANFANFKVKEIDIYSGLDSPTQTAAVQAYYATL
jgi:hypothetical protein